MVSWFRGEFCRQKIVNNNEGISLDYRKKGKKGKIERINICMWEMKVKAIWSLRALQGKECKT